MSVFFIADPHLGHKAIAKYREFVSSTESNTEFFIKQWKATVRKKDLVFMLGDVAFDEASLDVIDSMLGRKVLISGNHDNMVSMLHKTQVFEEIHGMIGYKKIWLTHCPIHPDEMRGRAGNVHGHVHQKSISLNGEDDPFYFNACVDSVYPKTSSWFTSLDQIKKYFNL
jgi:calcineurin-like phosphoesterase family protein